MVPAAPRDLRRPVQRGVRPAQPLVRRGFRPPASPTAWRGARSTADPAQPLAPAEHRGFPSTGYPAEPVARRDVRRSVSRAWQPDPVVHRGFRSPTSPAAHRGARRSASRTRPNVPVVQRGFRSTAYPVGPVAHRDVRSTASPAASRIGRPVAPPTEPTERRGTRRTRRGRGDWPSGRARRREVRRGRSPGFAPATGRGGRFGAVCGGDCVPREWHGPHCADAVNRARHPMPSPASRPRYGMRRSPRLARVPRRGSGSRRPSPVRSAAPPRSRLPRDSTTIPAATPVSRCADRGTAAAAAPIPRSTSAVRRIRTATCRPHRGGPAHRQPGHRTGAGYNGEHTPRQRHRPTIGGEHAPPRRAWERSGHGSRWAARYAASCATPAMSDEAAEYWKGRPRRWRPGWAVTTPRRCGGSVPGPKPGRSIQLVSGR